MKENQIPLEVVEAAVNAYAGAIWDADAKPIDYQHAMTVAIAAALVAWPGMQRRFHIEQALILPLPQEKQ
jgi:hypothetical protein